MPLTLRYAGFAVLATLLNLAVQRAVIAGLGAAQGLVPAMAMGTLAGLALKYLLDKRWIFADPTAGATGIGRQFGLYSLMGLVTTALFWTTETGFWLLAQSQAWREAGAVLGLGLGYSAKYFLDRRFVFARGTEEPA